MYSQVYFHPVRRIYDTHLMDFLKEWLNEGVFSTTVVEHLNITDNEVTAAMLKAAFVGTIGECRASGSRNRDRI